MNYMFYRTNLLWHCRFYNIIGIIKLPFSNVKKETACQFHWQKIGIHVHVYLLPISLMFNLPVWLVLCICPATILSHVILKAWPIATKCLNNYLFIQPQSCEEASLNLPAINQFCLLFYNFHHDLIYKAG